MIQFQNVTKNYGQSEALKEASFTIPAGDFVFVTGHSGAGKSTLLKLIAAIEKPSTGSILLGNQNLSSLSKHAIPYYRRKLGLIFQDPMLIKTCTVQENVGLPLVMVGVPPQDMKRRVQAALNRVGLGDKAACLPARLSCGEQQRVSIARAIINKPNILLADEPTGNLDPELSLEMMRLLERFHQAGTTVIIASHDIHLLKHFSYRRINLKQGECSISTASEATHA